MYRNKLDNVMFKNKHNPYLTKLIIIGIETKDSL